MSRHKVLVVTHHALPHVGGLENAVDLEIRGLAAAGHEVVLLTSDMLGAGRTPAYPANVTVERVPAFHGLERRFGVPYPIFSPSLLWRLRHWIDWADTVHAHGFMFMDTAIAVWMAAARGKAPILTDHGGIQRFGSRAVTLLARLGAETVGRLTSLTASRIVTYNSRVQGQLNHLGRRSDAEFLPNPVDRQLFYPPTPKERAAARERLGWAPDRKKVLFVGRLIATKGVPLLLSTIDPEYDLVFCGPGDVGVLGSLPRPGVEYLPPRPQAELIPLYHAADVLALPAEVREGFPLVVQEALLCGLPVVLGYDPGFEPYRGLPGLRFTDRTPENLKSALRLAMNEPMSSSSAKELEAFFPPLDEWVGRLFQWSSDGDDLPVAVGAVPTGAAGEFLARPAGSVVGQMP